MFLNLHRREEEEKGGEERWWRRLEWQRLGGENDQDMDNGPGHGHLGRVLSEPVLGRRRQREEWAGWRDTDKMPPKSPFVSD